MSSFETDQEEPVEDVVEQVLMKMRQRLGEELTLDDLAVMARFSKFHFARMFRRVTGVSPRRFLYALRLQEAKRLLVSTSLSVAEVSNRVGYRSVGTFTSRFTASIGVPPAVYRRCAGRVSWVLHGDPPEPGACGVITGRIEVPACGAGAGICEAPAGQPVLVGLFRHPVPEGRPARSLVLGNPGDWSLTQVPAGRWYVAAVLPHPGDAEGLPGWHGEAGMMCVEGPVKVGSDKGSSDTPCIHLTGQLRPVRVVDPPILLPLASLRQRRAPGKQPGWHDSYPAVASMS